MRYCIRAVADFCKQLFAFLVVFVVRADERKQVDTADDDEADAENAEHALSHDGKRIEKCLYIHNGNIDVRGRGRLLSFLWRVDGFLPSGGIGVTGVSGVSGVSVYQGDDKTTRNDGGNLSRDVDADRMHQQEVFGVFFQPHFMYHPRRHGEGRDARRPDHGVDLFVFGQKQVQQFGKQHAAGRIEDEGHKAQREDQEGLFGEKIPRLHFGGDGNAQQQGHQAGQYLLCGL